MAVEFKYDAVNKEYIPTLYPGESSEGWEIPDGISTDFHRLNSIIESKYSREYLKVCAFYNKMFPSLKASDWAQASYNAPPFTLLDQERSDTGTGIDFNYLKQIVDQLTSRLGTITFTPMLLIEDQSYEYIIYKDEVERILKSFIRKDDFNRTTLSVFHDASILGYSHVFIDPFIGKLVKASDYEVGMFESQFNKGNIVQMLYRDYAFPVTEVIKYLVDCDEAKRKELLESMSGRNTVDFKMYFNCAEHKVYITIDNKTLPAHDYPFDHVIMATFQWDVGFAKQLTTSEFDLLYPLQREINKIAAKIQQMIRMYKGAVPVFNSDVDLAMKAITNGSGEALYIDSSRPTSELMTVINPTPLDPQLSAEITNYKTAMYELAGIQNASFDMENMRSAAAVVALDQTRDSIFQAQLSGMAQFIKNCLTMLIEFLAVYPQFSAVDRIVDWPAIAKLIKQCYINLQPVHLNDPLSADKANSDVQQTDVDYLSLAVSRCVLDIIKGRTTYESIPFFIDKHLVIGEVAMLLIKFEALGITVPDSIMTFLIAAFIDAVANGEVAL